MTITAGMAREVCETCAWVRITFVDDGVGMGRPSIVDTVPEFELDLELEQEIGEVLDVEDTSEGALKCRLCSQPAMFMIPDGLSCDEHAWQAAARIIWDEVDPWVPIKIDRSNA